MLKNLVSNHDSNFDILCNKHKKLGETNDFQLRLYLEGIIFMGFFFDKELFGKF